MEESAWPKVEEEGSPPGFFNRREERGKGAESGRQMKIRIFIVFEDFGSTVKAAWPISVGKEEFPKVSCIRRAKNLRMPKRDGDLAFPIMFCSLPHP